MGNQPPIWATGPAKKSPEVRRAIDPETGKSFAKLGPIQKLKLKTMKGILTPLIARWLPRQLIKLIAPLATLIGATSESTDQVALFIVAGVGFLLDLILSKLSRRFLKENNPS